MRRVLGGLVGMVLALGVGMVGPAEAQVLSPGCTELNDPKYDAVFTGGQIVGPLLFTAGEVITVTATPVSGGPTQLVLRGFVAGEPDRFLDTDGVPGTVSAAVPTTEVISVRFRVTGGVNPTANFTVTCTAAPYPLAVNAALPSLAGQHASTLLPLDDPSDSSASTLISLGVLTGIVAVQVVGVGLLRRRQTPQG